MILLLVVIAVIAATVVGQHSVRQVFTILHCTTRLDPRQDSYRNVPDRANET